MKDKTLTITKVTIGIIGTLLIAGGVLCFFFDETIPWLIGAVLAVVGIINIVWAIKDGKKFVFSGLLVGNGILDILFAILFIVASNGMNTVMTVLFALMLIALGFTALGATGILRHFSEGKAWVGVMVVGLAAIVLGVVAVANPGEGGVGQTIFNYAIGVILILIGVGYYVLDAHLIRSAKPETEEKLDKYYTDVKD
ncbi:MAG: DUF308 domain-containing protein [Acutalibacteraceae bacterium]|jgi:uncharacterized membrane protein HdeD (DUF308 family)|nr:DUF308 domain-containing protein [Acutalibacteraceae bacterium]